MSLQKVEQQTHEMGHTLATDHAEYVATGREGVQTFQDVLGAALETLKTLRRTLYAGQNAELQSGYSFVDCGRMAIRVAQDTLADIHKDPTSQSVTTVANNLKRADDAAAEAFDDFVAAQVAVQEVVLTHLDMCMDSIRNVVQPKITLGLEAMEKQGDLAAQAAQSAIDYTSA